MSLNFSTRFKGETKRMRLDSQTRCMADLMLMGWNAQDAFIASGQYKPVLSDEYNKQQIEQIISDDSFLSYQQKKSRAIKRGFRTVPLSAEATADDEENDSAGKYRDKDSVLDALAATVKDLKGKERADVLMKIADLQQMKKEETAEEDNTVHYYLPISCKNCELYMKARKRRQEQEKEQEEE